MSEFQALQAQPYEVEVAQAQVVEEEPDEEETTLRPILKGGPCDRRHFMTQTSQPRPVWSNVKRLPWKRLGFLPKLLYQVTEVSDGHSFTVTSQGRHLPAKAFLRDMLTIS